MEGERDRNHGAWPSYTAGGGQPGRDGGGTLTMASTDVTNDDWENIFGPAGRDVKFDTQRYKREGRLHLPSALDGVNHYLTDRIDGLITDATNSPFTTVILPYQYLHNPDAKFTWNRYSFDEGLANRVPYESAARTLAQTRRSYEGYTVRQGLAITMEHNFMMSPAGRENFFNKWHQVVGSIQKTNDLDVHIALLSAPSYATEIKNKYYSRTKTPHQIIREHVEMFGFMQKNVNALDILIEEAKITLQTWGSQPPNFMLCNSKLTMQLTMTPEKTNFITQGYDGLRRLKAGPMLDSYRNLSIIHSRAYSLETGAPPRDLLRRRVRVAEYYRIPWQTPAPNEAAGTNIMVDLYDESKDTFFTVSWKDLLNHAALDEADRVKFGRLNESRQVYDLPLQSAVCGRPEDNGDVMGDDVIVARYVPDVAVPAADLGSAVYRASGDLAMQQRHPQFAQRMSDAYPNDADYATSNGLVLITNKVQGRRKLPLDAARREEFRSFYTASGWFNGPRNFDAQINNVPDIGFWYSSQFGVTLLGLIPSSLLQADFQYVFDQQGLKCNPFDPLAMAEINEVSRLRFFKTLALGHLCNEPATPNIGLKTKTKRVGFGMRPNLHVGRMVYAKLKPDTMRFKHVAANIMAQVAVTRPMANYLMQQAEKTEPTAEIRSKIRSLFGLSNYSAPNMTRYTQTANMTTECGYFGVETSVLAYMAAAVMHPDQATRDYCSGKLNEINLGVNQVGENLVTWIKCFLNSVPASSNATAPLFDCMIQGRALENTFAVLAQDPAKNQQGGVDTREREKLPVMYLGGYIKQTDIEGLLGALPVGTVTKREMLDTLNVPKWEYSITDPPMYRDVNEDTFDSKKGTVFPGGEATVKSEDVIAVMRSATAHDSLIAFVTIMCKRFFTDSQELYVETAEDVINVRNGELPLEGDIGETLPFSRRALTSNEYPSIMCGGHETLKDVNKWEIVIIRPNIEHNMLAAVLGRGGMDDLGATFWGQTELSCYDDSMHGIWGMSYKYHERAMVTNEKNLIRLWDVAYDGYNGGKDDTFVSWTEDSGHRSWKTLLSETANTTMPYTGPSLMVSLSGAQCVATWVCVCVCVCVCTSFTR